MGTRKLNLNKQPVFTLFDAERYIQQFKQLFDAILKDERMTLWWAG